LQKRVYGEGEIRLGTSIDLDPSIYSYAYALCICNEDITDFMDLVTGEVHAKEVKDGDTEENSVLAFLKERLGVKEEGGEKGIELSKIGDKKEEKTNVNESSSSSDSDTGEENSAPLVPLLEARSESVNQVKFNHSSMFSA